MCTLAVLLSSVVHTIVQYRNDHISVINPYPPPGNFAAHRADRPSGYSGGRGGRPRARQVSPRGSPGPPGCEEHLLCLKFLQIMKS